MLLLLFSVLVEILTSPFSSVPQVLGAFKEMLLENAAVALPCLNFTVPFSSVPQVLGTVKNTLLVLFSVVFLGETVTKLQAAGYAVSLAGFAW